jgi:hypothetical protein
MKSTDVAVEHTAQLFRFEELVKQVREASSPPSFFWLLA